MTVAWQWPSASKLQSPIFWRQEGQSEEAGLEARVRDQQDHILESGNDCPVSQSPSSSPNRSFALKLILSASVFFYRCDFD
jgi:hypothetical protein